MIVEEYEDDYSNFFYNNTNTNLGKTGIFERPGLKQVFTNTLQNDIDEYIHVLNINKNYQNISNNHVQNSSESVIKKPLSDLTNVLNKKYNASNNKDSSNYKSTFKNEKLILKDDLFNIEKEDSNYSFLSPESDIDASNFLLKDLDTKNNLTDVSKYNSFKNQDYLAQYRYIVPIEKFYSYIDADSGSGRPKTAKKLIESPETESTVNNDLLHDDSSVEKEYTHFPGDSNGGSEHQETDNRSMWILKIQLWIDKLKNKKRVDKSLRSRTRKYKCSATTKSMISSKNIDDVFVDTFKDLNQYSKFFINEPNNFIGDSIALHNTVQNSTNMILRQTSFDDEMIKIHHHHYLFLSFLSPINCSLCLRYIRENNLEDELKKSRYFHVYDRLEKEIECMQEYNDISEEKIYESSLFNFWHGIKREISFKLKRNDSKSIKTIGSLRLPQGANVCAKSREFEAIVSTPCYYKSIKCKEIDHNELQRLVKKILDSFQSLDVIKSNITKYPMLKDSSNKTRSKNIILQITNEQYNKRLHLWNIWFWRSLSNVYLDMANDCTIRCNKCQTKILSCMETIVYRDQYNMFRERLCTGCRSIALETKVCMSELSKSITSVESEPHKDLALVNEESHLEDEEYFEVDGFNDVVNLIAE
ncbi:uncharacterized protein HGUI_01550 [Hanseniaspora guilliermondii]|uniref:DUF4211 domain-containing protein n=1 Tax=Hanseniaspora guilliermondii TaxID=56406 RepID=A0A1L0FIC7_9ASCO|nr:uncharacterized protein HGUI_01550 [Hanseniaspora guilliermondii]